MYLHDGRVVSNFIVQALKNEDITIFGNGEQTKSLCNVNDLIDGTIKMMDSGDSFTGPVNLGNPTECSIIELSKNILDLTNSKSKIINKPLPTDDPVRRKPDIKLAEEKLSWEPKINLKEGLIKTIDNFKKELNLK